MAVRKAISLFLVCLVLASCTPRGEVAAGDIPVFDHVVWIVLENRNYEEVIGSPEMPYLNRMAEENVLLDQYYAVRHPSLPNYIALVGGSTFGISKDCVDCFVDGENLADRIEASNRTWKSYQEDMPSACFIGNEGLYVQKHNPFLYFDSIRLEPDRCSRSIVPLSELEKDLAQNQLPDFAFLSPNMCHSGHDCELNVVDQWLEQVIEPLHKSPALGDNSLIVITFDEARKDNREGCCGLGWRAGGRVATVLISPQASPKFIDSTRYSHYSLLKTILLAWDLPELGATKRAATRPILAPWK